MEYIVLLTTSQKEEVIYKLCGKKIEIVDMRTFKKF